MSNEVEWIETLLFETGNQYPSVPKAVLSRIEALLKAQLSERPLPAAELKSVAISLIADMVPNPLDTEEKGED